MREKLYCNATMRRGTRAEESVCRKSVRKTREKREKANFLCLEIDKKLRVAETNDHFSGALRPVNIIIAPLEE